MKREFRGFVAGFIFCTAISGSAVAAGLTQSIDVVKNDFIIKVNKQKVEFEHFVYQGTTYVPVRNLAEALGKNVSWNKEKKTIYIDDEINNETQAYIDSLSASDYIKPMNISANNDSFLLALENALKHGLQMDSKSFISSWNNTLLNNRIYEINLSSESLLQYDNTYIVVLDNSKETSLESDSFVVALLAYDNYLKSVNLLDFYTGYQRLNLHKFELASKDDYIMLWSQGANSSKETVCVLKSKNSCLIPVNNTQGLAAGDYYGQLHKLLSAGKVEEALALNGKPLNPDKYKEQYYATSSLALQVASSYALEKYQQGELNTAVKVLEWGMNEYILAQTGKTFSKQNPDILNELLNKSTKPAGDYKISEVQFAMILNDYGYYLTEEGHYNEALDLLLKVIEFDPDRTVAYINLGDVCWELGNVEDSRRYYNEYVRMLGDNNSVMPERVRERLN